MAHTHDPSTNGLTTVRTVNTGKDYPVLQVLGRITTFLVDNNFSCERPGEPTLRSRAVLICYSGRPRSKMSMGGHHMLFVAKKLAWMLIRLLHK